MQATITYDEVTPESAENGDVSEAGFFHPGGWRLGIDDPDAPLPVGEVLRWAAERGCWRDNGDGSFYCESYDEDYRTGACTSYAVHFKASAASLVRISRVLGATS